MRRKPVTDEDGVQVRRGSSDDLQHPLLIAKQPALKGPEGQGEIEMRWRRGRRQGKIQEERRYRRDLNPAWAPRGWAKDITDMVKAGGVKGGKYMRR